MPACLTAFLNTYKKLTYQPSVLWTSPKLACLSMTIVRGDDLPSSTGADHSVRLSPSVVSGTHNPVMSSSSSHFRLDVV